MNSLKEMLLMLLFSLMILELFIVSYLMKSSLNINLMKTYSLGLWGWFNQHILNYIYQFPCFAWEFRHTESLPTIFTKCCYKILMHYHAERGNEVRQNHYQLSLLVPMPRVGIQADSIITNYFYQMLVQNTYALPRRARERGKLPFTSLVKRLLTLFLTLLKADS